MLVIITASICIRKFGTVNVFYSLITLKFQLFSYSTYSQLRTYVNYAKKLLILKIKENGVEIYLRKRTEIKKKKRGQGGKINTKDV